ncbi:MAG: PAS domain S-box protein [Candidatus Lokiarchaeota archaeon]|nr:PAS domain S-box protein [Candidatus Lokiarchaeota archaeon]
MKVDSQFDFIPENKNKEIGLKLLRKGFEESPNSQVIAEYRDNEVHILHINKAFTKYYGYSQEEALGKNPRILNSGEMDALFFEKLWNAILDANIGFWRGEIINRRKNGEFIHVILTINTIFDEEGLPRYFTAYHVDITDRKIAEEKLRISEERYRSAYERANLYSYLVVHDINNIFQVITSAMELSSIQLNTFENLRVLKELYDIINNQVARGVQLVSNVGKLSLIEESEVSLKKINVSNFLSEAINYVKQSFQNKNVHIKIDLGDTNLFVIANDLLLDVFENLLINSIRHNNSSKIQILVIASKFYKNNQKAIKFEFQDNGVGISDERKSKIFTRGKDLKKKTEGMGLGLSLVKKIIESYSGEIWIEDRIKGDFEKGSSFVFIIPEA